MTKSDDELLRAARAGDKRALETLLTRHQRQIYRFSMKMCRHPEDAKDVLQDTLLAMARGVRDFRGASSLSTWLYTVARSYCSKKRRKEPPARERPQAREPEATAPGADELLAGRQVERAVERAIGGLEPMYREVLLLRDVEGLTAPEVADILKISVQAVKSRLHRARLAVCEQVTPLLGVPGSPRELCAALRGTQVPPSVQESVRAALRDFLRR